MRALVSARRTAWRALRPRRWSSSTTQIQACVSNRSTACWSSGLEIDVVLAVHRIEWPLVLQHGAPHRAEHRAALSRIVGHELRHRAAVLGHHERGAGL